MLRFADIKLLLLLEGRRGSTNVREVAGELLGWLRRTAESSPPVRGQAGALNPPGSHVAVPAPRLGLLHRGGGQETDR